MTSAKADAALAAKLNFQLGSICASALRGFFSKAAMGAALFDRR